MASCSTAKPVEPAKKRQKKAMQLIGITGTLGAGKGTVVDYLLRPPHSYTHYSARSLLNEIIAERGLPPGRDSMREVRIERLDGFVSTIANTRISARASLHR
eukprot:SAG31_NODE_4007_length_3670_cov_1.628955_7_plen_102_part_00